MLFRLYNACLIIVVLVLLQACNNRPPILHTPDYKGQLTLPDGSVYKGKLENGLLHGQGEINWLDGSSYKGDFYQGIMQGKGVYIFSDGSTYTGTFAKGLPNGYGVIITEEGNRKEGYFVNGNMKGQGEHIFASGASYKGRFEKDQFAGQGVYISEQGDRYVGDFEKNAADGQVNINYATGATYHGAVKKWQFHGQGEYVTKNGNKYIATFVHDEATGPAKILYKDGDIYEGDLKNWEFHGTGLYKEKEGHIYKGDFISGSLTGKAEIDYGEGYRYQGEVMDWKPNGYGELIMPKRGVYTGQFKEEKFNGSGRIVYQGGDIFEGEFKDSMKHGQGTLTLKNPKGRKTVTTGWWVEDSFYGEDKPPEQETSLAKSILNTLSKKIAPKKKTVNAEKVLYSQYEILNRHLDALQPSAPGKSELFFISFGSYGSQDLFMKEAKYSKVLFDEHFQTQKHSISLINNSKTIDEMPLASVTNLELSLNRLGRLMGEEDILFLFLTSHGSKDHTLSVSLSDVPLNDLSATQLSEIINNSQIKWKVIVVSSCYSGGFIDALKDDYTLVLTASSSDHVSFGCSDTAEFTYFGKAFFEQSVKQSKSFRQAFAKTVKAVTIREKKDGYSHSNPQIYMGAEIEKQLKKWRAQL